MCPRCEGLGTVSDNDLTQLFDDSKSLDDRALTIPGYKTGGWNYRLCRCCPRTGRRSSRTSGRSWTGRSRSPTVRTVAAPVSARRRDLRRSTGSTLPTPARCRSANSASGCAASTSRRWRRCRQPAAAARLVRRDRARLSRPRPAVGHAVGRRGATREDDPPAWVLADGCHLRIRRADGRAPPARHSADVPAAVAVARQGQHGARRRAQTRDDFDRRSRRRPRPRRRQCRRRNGVRGYGRGPAGQRHDHRAAFPRTGRLSRIRSDEHRDARGPRCGAPTTTRTSMSTSRSACWSS